VRQRKPDETRSPEWIRPFWFLFTVGWYVSLSILIPTGIGYYVDQPGQLNSRPLYTLIGFGVGTIVAFYGLYRMLKRYYLEQQVKRTNSEAKSNST